MIDYTRRDEFRDKGDRFWQRYDREVFHLVGVVQSAGLARFIDAEGCPHQHGRHCEPEADKQEPADSPPEGIVGRFDDLRCCKSDKIAIATKKLINCLLVFQGSEREWKYLIQLETLNSSMQMVKGGTKKVYFNP